MNFLPALPTAAWFALAAVPLGIVLLYFLKLRRQPIAVPSTYLWARTIEDLHVNSLIQRLRNNLLLLLQLLFIALLGLALLRPGWQSTSGEARRFIFLLDASASMAATDVEGFPTRFAAAKQKVADLIDAMQGEDVAMLIAFSDRSDVLQEFTDNRRSLRQALERATVTSRPTEIMEALRAAAGLANPNRTSQAGDVKDVPVADALPASMFIISDGGFATLDEFSLGNLTPTYIGIGSTQPRNVAITAFSAERSLDHPEQVQAFARVANFSQEPLATTASLMIGGELVDAQRVELEPEAETGLSFQIDSAEAASLRLALEVEDDLAVDNEAYAALAPLRDVAVLLVTPGNRPLEIGLETAQAQALGQVETRPPEYLRTDEYRQRAELGRDDLIIYDRCAPEEMPASNTFFVGSLPPSDWSASDLTGPILPIDIDRTHPIMQFLELFSLKIVEGRALQPPRGAVSLITADVGPVMVVAPREGYQDLVMGFEILSENDEGQTMFNTDWPVERSWPVFVFNAMRTLGGAVETSAAVTVKPGETVTLRVDNRLRQVRLDAPGKGPLRRLAVGPAGAIPFADTDRLGLYRVLPEEDDDPLSIFTVNLFDSRESNLATAEKIGLGYEEVERSEGAMPQRSELWRWLLAIALGILTVEWIVFNRRLI